MSCSPDLDSDAGLCYPRCRPGYHGVSFVCWGDCPAQFSVNCGAGCAKSSGECAQSIANQVRSPIEVVANIGLMVGTGGGSAAATTAARAGTAVAKATIKSQLQAAARRAGKELAESALENAATTMYEAQATGQFNWADLDPTGIASVVDAYYKPVCSDAVARQR